MLEVKSHHLDGQVVCDWLAEAPWHTAVLRRIDEGSGAQDMMQQVARKDVALLTFEVKGQLQYLDQVRGIGQELVTIYSRNLSAYIERRPNDGEPRNLTKKYIYTSL